MQTGDSELRERIAARTVRASEVYFDHVLSCAAEAGVGAISARIDRQIATVRIRVGGSALATAKLERLLLERFPIDWAICVELA